MRWNFIHWLRALGCLSVIYCHLGMQFFLKQDGCRAIGLFTNVCGGGIPTLVLWTQFRYFDFGMYGVALFFLISGFLIFESMKGRSPGEFLFKRLFRLYSLYIWALLFVCGVLYASAKLNEIPFPYGVKVYLQNVSLFRNWLWATAIDGVVWTMEVDVFFYIVCTITVWLLPNLRAEKAMVFFSTMGCLVIYLFHGLMPILLQMQLWYLYTFFYNLQICLMFFPVMFIGMILRQYLAGRLAKKTSIFFAMLLYLVFCVNCHYFWMETAFACQYCISYGCAILTFYGFYQMRSFIDAYPNRVISWFADISFPLYLIHAAAGYAMLGYLYRLGIGLWSFVVVSVVMLILAWVLHVYVEEPMNKIAKRILILNTNKTRQKGTHYGIV